MANPRSPPRTPQHRLLLYHRHHQLPSLPLPLHTRCAHSVWTTERSTALQLVHSSTTITTHITQTQWPNRVCASAKRASSSPTQNVRPPSSLLLSSSIVLTITLSRRSPRSLWRYPTPPRDPHNPRRNNHRLHHRNLPQRRNLRILLASPKDQSRRFQMGVEKRCKEVGQSYGNLLCREDSKG